MRLSWRGVNYLFLGTAAVQFVAEGHLVAFTPLLLQDLGLSPAEVAVWSGLLFAVMTAVAFPLAPLWGVLGERFSRRWVVVRSYYLLAAALLVSAWAPSVAFLIVGRILVGLCFGTMGVIISTQALLTPRRRLGSAIATVQAAQPIAVSLGPPLGALAIPWIGLRELFVLDAAITLVAGLVLTWLMPEPAERVKRGTVLGRMGEVLGLAWSRRPIRWNFISAFMLRGATAVVDAYLPVRITQLAEDPARAIGWILGLYGLMSTVATWLLSRIVDRVDETKLYVRTMLFATLLMVGMAAAPSVWLLGILAVLRAIPVACGNTLLHTHTARNLPGDLQTAIFSLAPMPRNGGSLLFPLLAAAVASVAPGAALAVGAVGYAGTFLASLRMRAVTRATAAELREPVLAEQKAES